MNMFAHDGLQMWYGTPDAPAPEGTIAERRGISVTVGVRPANPAIAVRLRYRVDGRRPETVSAPFLADDFPKRTRYFRATFPTFWSGDTVEYLPLASCAGRRVPDSPTARTFPSSFRLSASSVAPSPDIAAERRGLPQAEFPPRLQHLVHVRVTLTDQPEIVGQTPAGFVVNWAPVSGTLDGPAFHATVIPGGEHQTTVRPDGIGILSASLSIMTADRDLIAVYHSGLADYGADWAVLLSSGRWPSVLPVRTHIRLSTAAASYQWLNRLYCLSLGEVRAAEHLYVYDMYAVR